MRIALAKHARVRTFAVDEAFAHPLVHHHRLDSLAIQFDVEPFGHAANLSAKLGIAMDHRHPIDGLIEIFDDRL